MSTVRTVLAVVLGFILIAAASMATVAFLFGDGQPPGTGSVVGALILMAVAALLAGWLTAKVAGGPRPRIAAAIVAAMLVALGMFSLTNQAGVEPVWYKLASVVVFGIFLLVGAALADRQPP